VSIEEDRGHALRAQQRIVNAMPRRLAEREDQFAEQIKRAKVGPLKKLGLLYSFMEELAAVTSRFTPCAKGCASCCHYAVSVSPIEVEYIERHTRRSRNRVLRLLDDPHGMPCPFLRNGACSIYEARPFVCRRHHALTPTAYWCEPSRSYLEELPLVAFTAVDEAYQAIRLESDPHAVHDIRQVFG
jgi:uncharacterized protein